MFTEGLFKFDGNLAEYKAWKNRLRDHTAESWPPWRQVLDYFEKSPEALTTDYLNSVTVHGVNAMSLSADLWSFLLRWIGTTLYMRRTNMGFNIEGNGLELWRRLYTEFEGSDELVRMAGRSKLLDHPPMQDLREPESRGR